MTYYSIIDARGTGDYITLATPPYLRKEHIYVYVDGLPTTAYEWIGDTAVRLIAPINRLVRVVRRTSPGTLLTEYKDGTQLPGVTLTVDSKQAFYMAQEALDLALLAGGSAGGTVPPGVELTQQGIKDLLEGQITPSLLELTLRSEIGLITAGPGVVGSPAWLASEEARNRAAAIVAEGEARMQALLAEAANRQADIQNERTLWQSADFSLAQEILQITAAVGQNLAAIQIERDARSDADAAIATSMEQLEARYKAADLVLAGSVESLSQATAQADAALAQDLTLVKAQIGGGDNMFPNPLLARGANVPGMADAAIKDRGAPGTPSGAPTDRMLAHDTRDLIVGDFLPCAFGDTFEFDVWVGLSAPLSGSPATNWVFQFKDAGGNINWVNSYEYRLCDYTGWKRLSGSVVVPSGATSVRLGFQVNRAASLGQPAVYYTLPVFRRKAASTAAVETNASAIATKVAGVEANYTIKVQARVDGKLAVAGIGLNATASNSGPTQSEMVFLADKFTFVPDMNGLNFTPQPLFVAGVVDGQNTFVLPRQRLGDKLIEARMIVDGGIEARHMKITGSRGAALNADPSFADATAWTLGGSGAFLVVGDGAVGNTAFRSNPTCEIYSLPIPCNPARSYRVRCRARRSASANGVLYMGLAFADAEGNNITGNGTFWYVGAVNSAVPAAWTEFSGHVGPGSALPACPPNGRTMRVIALVNYSGNAGYMDVQDLRVEEMLDSSLVVEGGISADRIDTRGLTIKDQYGNVLFGSGTGLNWNQLTGIPALESPSGAQAKADAAQSAAANDATNKANQAATTAVWSGVSGAGKPQDNATVGATIGGNLAGSFTQASWDTYMTSAFIRAGHIQSLSANQVVVTNGLSDISSNVGLLRNATSGGRQEIEAHRTRIYDGNNALRVKIGYLL